MTERRARYTHAKQRSRAVTIYGVDFASQAESRRYLFLLSEQQAGRISDLEPHPKFILQPSCKRDGATVQAITYTADFAYTRDGARVVEDVKAWMHNKRTGKRVPLVHEDCALKVKMLRYQHPEIMFMFTEA